MTSSTGEKQVTDPCAKGTQLLAEAESALGAPPGLCCGAGGRRRPEAACALYTQAGNAFKGAKEWGRAGLAFEEAAGLELANSRTHEAGSHFAEAAKCYKKVSTAESAKCLLQAAEVYAGMTGRQRVAAKHHQALAELYEEEGNLKDLAQSVHHYRMAAEFFAGEESSSAANKCWLNVAKHSVMLDEHKQAVEIFERVARDALESSLLRYTAADLFLRAGLCRLYMAAVASSSRGGQIVEEPLSEALSNYQESSPAFAESREFTLLSALIRNAVDGDPDAFNEAVRSHESVSPLDPWHHELLRTLRKHVRGAPDLR